jgi:hypothetical protein
MSQICSWTYGLEPSTLVWRGQVGPTGPPAAPTQPGLTGATGPLALGFTGPDGPRGSPASGSFAPTYFTASYHVEGTGVLAPIVPTVYPFDFVVTQNFAAWSYAQNAFIMPASGLYSFFLNFRLSSAALQTFTWSLSINGVVAETSSLAMQANSLSSVSRSRIQYLNANDTVSVLISSTLGTVIVTSTIQIPVCQTSFMILSLF